MVYYENSLLAGQAAYDVAKTETMKQLLTVKPKTEAAKVPQRFEGILMKVI